MEKCKIKFNDEEVAILPDVSYDKFTEYMPWSGANDTAYDEYLRQNNMVHLDRYRSDCTNEIILEFSYADGRVMKFKCIYDSDNDL